MLDVIMVVPLPISGWKNVVDRETFLLNGVPTERLVGTLPALVESLDWMKQINPDRDPPCRIVVAINGGIRDDMVEIESFLKGIDLGWHIIQSTEVQSEARLIERAIQECNQTFIVLCPGTTLVRESTWMDKMNLVYSKDRNCCMVGTDPFIRDNNFPPYKLPRTDHPKGGLVLIKKNIVDSLNFEEMDPDIPVQEEISRQIQVIRGNRWMAPSVRFSDQKWASTKPERSATAGLSE